MTAQMTRAGVILGTAAYMSPEQASQRATDKRTDIWAFGCMLFEMLSGRRPFPGDSFAEMVAAIIRSEPDLDKLPQGMPAELRRLIARCLRKSPRRRLRDIGDARNALEEIRDEPELVDAAAGAQPRARPAGAIPWALAGVLATVSLALAFFLLRGEERPAPVRRFAIDLPWHSAPNWSDFEVALSPTGEHIAYNGRVGNRVQAYIRSLTGLEARPVAPARESVWMTFSPDGNWLALFHHTTLSKVPVHGGQQVPLAEFADPSAYVAATPGRSDDGGWAAPAIGGLSWGSRGDLLIGSDRGLLRVPEEGGAIEKVTSIDEAAGWTAHFDPRHLPGGDRALVAVWRAADDPTIAIVDLDDGSLTHLPITAAEATLTPDGHLVFRHEGTVMVVPFDLGSLSLRGDPVQVLDGVRQGPLIAADGTMLYVPSRGGVSRLFWTDRSGRPTPANFEPGRYSHIDLGRDGRTTLIDASDGIYAADLVRGSRRLLATDAGFPILTTNDRQATIFEAIGRGLYQQPVGGGEGTALLDAADQDARADAGRRPIGTLVPTSWNAATGDLAFFDEASDIWVRRPDGSLQPFLDSPANERTGRFSSDGAWLAYVSDETGEYEVYVTDYPGSEQQIPVSIAGGLSPIWHPGGSELFFRNGGKLMSAAVAAGADLAFDPPVELFEGPYTMDLMGHQRWDVAPGGDRFLMVENSGDFRTVIVLNWVRELNELIPIEP
jgi:hypothetical protein